MKDLSSENESLLLSHQKLMDFLMSVYGSESKSVLFKVDPIKNTGFVIASTSEEYNVHDDITPLVKKILLQSSKGYNYLINISADSDETEQQKLSYFLIRNSSSQTIGIFLIIFNIDFMLQAKKTLDQILGFESINNRPQEFNDLYFELDQDGFSVDNYVQNIIKTVILDYGIEVGRLTTDEKSEIIHKLKKMDVFHIRDSVKETAKQLSISIPTVYRIMKKQKQHKQD